MLTNGPLPDSTLALERIHGYTGKKIRGNLHYLNDGDCIVYNVGKILVLYNVREDIQHFFHDACGEITCLSVHLKRSICAIGQENAPRSIIIVDLKTMKPLTFLTGHTEKVLCLDFDESGKYLVSVGSEHNQELILHDWKNGTVIASSQTFGLETLDVKFLKDSSHCIVQCGISFVRFWYVKGCFLSFEEVKLNLLENHVRRACISFVSVLT